MFEVMKTIHLLCLFGGGAGMIGNGILLTKMANSEGPPSDIVKSTMRLLGMTGLASILLLWLSGGGLLSLTGHAMDQNFTIKLIGATATLGAISALSLIAARSRKGGTSPNFATMKMLSRIGSVGALVAVVFAVIAFN